jgi:endonuclease G
MARGRNRSDGFDAFTPRDLRVAQFAARSFVRLDRQVQLAIVALLLVATVIGGAIYYRLQHRQQPAGANAGVPVASTTTAPAPPSALSSPHLLLGNPSGAGTDPANRDNYLMLKPWFALSYNNANGTANWVSWRLTRADLGDAPRKQIFDPDSELPRGFNVVTHRDYSGSGFDRGHLCPHGDRAADSERAFSTFVMTNVVPQAANLNQKAWNQLEDYCRSLVRRRGVRLYIIAGPYGRGGRGTQGLKNTIGGGKVTVPSDCWKIVVVVPDADGDGDDLAKITPATRVIAVLMPNDNDALIGQPWSKYRTTPADIEQRTGYHFFDRLPPDVAASLRQKLDVQRPPRSAASPDGSLRGEQ